jgi:tripeptidyl-peptidase-1
VTAVGATQFYSGGEEVAIFQSNGQTPTGSSGGGFSNYFSMPSYQSSDVEGYINGLNGASSGLYNANGRGYPDVALIGLNLDIVYQGSVTQIGGTSASSPEFAALISQINDYRTSEGKSTLGFLNPALYSADSSSFFDITVGSNEGCNTNGFPATTGLFHFLNFFEISC